MACGWPMIPANLPLKESPTSWISRRRGKPPNNQPENRPMPYLSQAQAAYFNIHRKKLERQGVDVNEGNKASKGLKLPRRLHPKGKTRDYLEEARKGR